MQFKLDENLPQRAADLLRGLGHDVMTAYDQGLQTSTDLRRWRRVRARKSSHIPGRGLLEYPGLPTQWYAGLIVPRLHKPGPRAVLESLAARRTSS